MKRRIPALALSGMLMLSSCTFPPEYVSQWDNRKKIEDVMDIIKDGGREELAEHFSEYLKTAYYDELLSEIDEMYAFLGGDIISYDEPENCGYGIETVHYGDIVLYISHPDVYNVVTSDGKKLWFSFGYTVVDDETPENVGINRIRILYMDRTENADEMIVSGTEEYLLKKEDKEQENGKR